MSKISASGNENYDDKIVIVKNRILKLSNGTYVYMNIMKKESRQT